MKSKKNGFSAKEKPFFGKNRGDTIRTCDLYVPNVAL